MDVDLDNLPDDPAAQRAMIHMLVEAIGDYRKLVAHLKHRIAKLEKIAFGRRSEKARLELVQLRLLLGDLEAPSLDDDAGQDDAPRAANDDGCSGGAGPATERSATPRPRKPLPDNLPREVVVHEVCTCPECGSGRLHKVGEERRTVTERVPATLKVVEHVFPRMRCRDCDKTRRAPPPTLPIDRAMVGPALLAHIGVAKYGDHIPLNRQSEMFARQGVQFSRQTLMNYVKGMATLCLPLYELIGEHVFAGDAFHIDDTPMWVLDRSRPRTREGRSWCAVRDERPWNGPAPPAAWYAHAPDKGGGIVPDILAGASGFMHADGDGRYLQVYDWRVAGADGTLVPCLFESGCWSHARRKFMEAWDRTSSDGAGQVLAVMAKLFETERDCRGQPPEIRLAMRQRHSAPRVARLKAWLDWAHGAGSTSMPIHEAIGYMLDRWPAFERFLTDGRVEMTNNAAERAIRPVVLGRRNYGFMGSDAGGERAAVLYTLVQTARLNKIDPEAWLADVLMRIKGLPAHRLPELLPWNWSPGRIAIAA